MGVLDRSGRTLFPHLCFVHLHLRPGPVEDLVCENGAEEDLEHRSAVRLVERNLRGMRESRDVSGAAGRVPVQW